MEVTNTMGAAEVLRKYLLEADPDLVRSMVQTFAEALMSAEVQGLCNAEYGEVSPERVNFAQRLSLEALGHQGRHDRLHDPKLRTGSYFPDWLIEPRRRAERALVAVVAQCYVEGVSTRRVDDVVRSMGIEGICKNRRRSRSWPSPSTRRWPPFATGLSMQGPYTYIWVDALTQKVREGGRIVDVAMIVIATGVNAEGHREILGLDLITSEDGAGWTAFLRGLVARGLSGVRLVSSPTPTADWSTPSPQCSPEQPGNAAGSTSCATSTPRCPRPPSPWWAPSSAPSSSNPTPSRSTSSTPGSSSSWPNASLTRRTCW